MLKRRREKGGECFEVWGVYGFKASGTLLKMHYGV